ncbi:zinc finger protein 782-like isoform X4 [Eleginops maclovinus]|uniref:zinc finger protein 782-like isoform X4 n=1 Tax=Eleginops maclovinus TaxID=56733 RepID=UPI00307FD7ED
MSDLKSFKAELTGIVSSLARALLTEICSAAERVSVSKHNPEEEDQLSTLLDALCEEAVENILKTLHLRDQPEEGGLMETRGGGGELPPAEQSYILVLGVTENQTVCVDPPPQAEIPDHEYALSSPPAAATASRSQRQRCRSRRRSSPDTSQSQAAGSPPLPCPQCRMLLPSAERLSEHQRKAHPACSLCGAAFSGILRLREHQRSEHGLLPFSCSFCSKSFNHKAHRELHEKARHTGEKSYHCDVCGKSYSCVSVLKTHRRTHFDRMFICDVCGKSFFHACHLTRHQLVHGGERPHRCSSCGRGFMQASNLRSHQAAHRGDTQLCSVCGKSYRHLKSHILSLHAAELPPPSEPGCPPLSPASCAAEHCPPPSQLREHQRSLSAEKPFSCDVGRKSFLRAHLQTRAHQTPDPSP